MAEPVLNLVMRDLVDALIQERLFGFADGEHDGEWYRVGEIRLRVRPGGKLQPWRYAGGPVLHGTREIGPDELIRLVAAEEPAVAQVADDLATAVTHAGVSIDGEADGERMAARRNRPFHPTARAVVGWTEAELARYGPHRRDPLGLDWLAVHTDCLRFGSGSREPAALLLEPGDHDRLQAGLPAGYTLVPVHPWHYDCVLRREFAAEIDNGAIRPVALGVGRFRPTSSLRTLVSADPARHVKLPLGVNTLGSARLLPPRYLDNGERGERLLRQVLTRDADLAALVTVCDERTWCGWAGDEFADRPGLLAAQVRSYPPEVPDAVPLGALAAEEWYRMRPVDPVPFFRALADDFCAMAIGFLRHGVLPELHGQNVARSGRRFVLRDHDAVRYCPGWLAAAGIPEPGYRVKPGVRQSLRLDDPGALVGFLQTLGFQVNLYGIADALTRHYSITENVLWNQLRAALTDCLDRLEPPPLVRRLLLEAPTWPSRQVLGPLLRSGRSNDASMPASTGTVPNPLAS